MSTNVLITREALSKIQPHSLPHLHKLFHAGILRIADLGGLSFPITSIQAYVFLQQQLQEEKRLSSELIDIIDTIIIDKESIIRQHLINSDDVVLGEAEIIETILELQPTIADRYRIEGGQTRGVQKQGKVYISGKETYAVSNVQNLCIAALSSQKLNLSCIQSLKIVKEVLMPTYFWAISIDFKSNLEAIRRVIAKGNQKSFEDQLSSLFLSLYQQYWKGTEFVGSLEQVSALERQFTLLEVVHSTVPYPRDLMESIIFRTHLKGLLQFSGQTRSSVHSLAVRVYQRVAGCMGEAGNISQVFVKLFNILGCYGSHLVKDVWGSFYGLVEGNDPAFFSKLELIDIVLGKLEHHQNSNVIKNCLHEFLKNENSNRIFQLTPSVVYGSLIRMLNLGVHYLDCLFHMDSKMYPLIANFFLKYYNSFPETLSQHLSLFLRAITSKANYDHALIALLNVFQKQKHPTTFLGFQALCSTKFLLLAAYNRYPIRKRFQLVDSLLGLINYNINRDVIRIGQLLQYFSLISEEYLSAGKLDKLKAILDKYSLQERKTWGQISSENVIEGVNNLINGQSEITLDQVCSQIKMLQLYQRLYDTEFPAYQNFFVQLVEEYGESRYKNLKQREIFLTVYALISNKLVSRLKQTRQFVAHLDAILNSIALYAQLRLQQHSGVDCQQKVLQIVSHLCRRVYGKVDYEEFKDREGERVVVARMMEWANDRIDYDPLALEVIITTCRARIMILNERSKMPHLYLNYEHLFQQTLYDLYDQLYQLEERQSQKSKCASLRKDKQLRLRVLLTVILLNDTSHKVSLSPPTCSDIGDIIDRYDFQNYEEVCWLVEAIYSPSCPAFKQRLACQPEAAQLARQLGLLLENMVHNLQYSLGKKEIVGLGECTMHVLLNFAYACGGFSESLVEFIKKLLIAGQNYLLFQRVVVLALAEEIYLHFSKLSQINYKPLIPLIVQALTIEQYRGFDSAVYLWEEQMTSKIYQKFGADLESNYEGAVPRFLLVFAFKEILKGELRTCKLQFLEGCIVSALQVCMTQVAKQKMFLSGKNKIKLQLWQFLLVFHPQQLPVILGKDGFCNLILRCIDAISHNLISQIRYYSEIFVMRLLTASQNFPLLNRDILRSLQKGLLGSLGNLNRTIAYIVVSGILIKHISENQNNSHFHELQEDLKGLYNCLLTYVGSSVAYFRGLSQFFCLELRSGCLQTKYVNILRQNFLLDKDAEHLMGKLEEVMREYIVDIKEWEVEREVLRKIPNSSHNVISDRYYMDILKQFSTQLAKINKNLDGFTAYRYIWRKNVAKGEPLEDDEEVGDEKEGDELIEEAQDVDENIFQRKIDPTLDHIYAQQRHSQLKLLVISSKSQALLGHLARTGEIFGIEQLILPCRKVIELDQFKSISVTAERWLKISDLGGDLGHPVNPKLALEKLIHLKSQGFQVVQLGKCGEGSGTSRPISVNRKCVLVLDEEHQFSSECQRLVDWQLQVGRHLSLHVEASIFIWSYFKQHVRHD